MLAWSKWFNINNYTAIDSKPGVYKIRFSHLRTPRPVSISRLLGKDKDGLLSIGQSVHLRNRIQKFCRVVDNRTGFFKHSAGDRLFLARICAHASSNNYFDDKNIQVSFITLKSKQEAKELEERLLKCYFKNYGELPPLNNSMPDENVKIWEEILISKCE